MEQFVLFHRFLFLFQLKLPQRCKTIQCETIPTISYTVLDIYSARYVNLLICKRRRQPRNRNPPTPETSGGGCWISWKGECKEPPLCLYVWRRWLCFRLRQWATRTPTQRDELWCYALAFQSHTFGMPSCTTRIDQFLPFELIAVELRRHPIGEQRRRALRLTRRKEPLRGTGKRWHWTFFHQHELRLLLDCYTASKRRFRMGKLEKKNTNKRNRKSSF